MTCYSSGIASQMRTILQNQKPLFFKNHAKFPALNRLSAPDPLNEFSSLSEVNRIL